MSILALWLTLLFVLVTMLLSLWQKLRLEKDILIAAMRTAVQLLAIGYILQFIFDQEHMLFIILILVVMITVAAWNAASRGKELRGLFWRVLSTIALTQGFTISFMLLLGVIEPTAQYIIPISGMITGNAMVVSGLLINQMKRSIYHAIPEIELLLSLGASNRQAVHNVLKNAVKSSMIPTIDAMRTVGLVQLPGMMTGMIIAGASPVEAVRYQILIMFSFSSSAALTSILLGMFIYPMWFTKEGQVQRIKVE